MPEIPSFLKEFIDMRKKLTTNVPPAEKKKKLKGETKPIDTALDGTSLASIIEKKPSKKVIEEYIQRRCDELTKEKMK
jgi:hypothetical protein